jgi:hypothetical protein
MFALDEPGPGEKLIFLGKPCSAMRLKPLRSAVNALFVSIDVLAITRHVWYQKQMLGVAGHTLDPGRVRNASVHPSISACGTRKSIDPGSINGHPEESGDYETAPKEACKDCILWGL